MVVFIHHFKETTVCVSYPRYLLRSQTPFPHSEIATHVVMFLANFWCYCKFPSILYFNNNPFTNANLN